MPGERKDAIKEIEEALIPAKAWGRLAAEGRQGAVKSVTLPAEIVERALSILPRLRAVVEAATKYLEPFETDVEPLRAALASLLPKEPGDGEAAGG